MSKINFTELADLIKKINDQAGNTAKNAVNRLMTLRNWVIGHYIVEYEQGGSDRAKYGTNLLKDLENQISQKGMNVTLFKSCRMFYLTYPQISSTVSNQFSLQLANNVKEHNQWLIEAIEQNGGCKHC